MTEGLVRYQDCGCFHFLTFSCYRRQPLFSDSAAYDVFEQEFEAARRRCGFVIGGYVLMPEHAHLLVGEPPRSTLASAIQVLKQLTSRRLKVSGEPQFWQLRYYDFNVHNEEKRVEKRQIYAPQSGEARTGREGGGLAVVELSALRYWPARNGRDRIPLDRDAARQSTSRASSFC
jgi:putative transposase